MAFTLLNRVIKASATSTADLIISPMNAMMSS